MKTLEVLVRMTVKVPDKPDAKNSLMVDVCNGKLVLCDHGGLRLVRFHVQGETIESVKEMS